MAFPHYREFLSLLHLNTKEKKLNMATSTSQQKDCNSSRMITRRAARLLMSSGVPSSDIFASVPNQRHTEKQMDTDTTNPNLQQMDTDTTNLNRQKKKKLTNPNRQKKDKLDTDIFEFYLEDLWSKISEGKRSSFTYFDSLWFSLYGKGSMKSKVLLWIKKKQIFTRKYIFVPIVCWRHWSLLILCHFGEKQKSKTKQPCMLLLDSLQSVDPKRLEPDIRRFVRDIYRSEERTERDDYISKIPLLIPKVPQQKSKEECGVYVLYFLYLFLQNAPDSFSQEHYPDFLNEEWFKLEDLEKFGKEIHTVWKNKDAEAARMQCDTESSVEDVL